tara:strand:+ start:706 stop:837 length:132 start_codon:yes stop_codon:yes gene_type:complete
MHLVVVTALTVAVIVRHDLAIWMACCFLMGREIGNSIIDLKKP